MTTKLSERLARVMKQVDTEIDNIATTAWTLVFLQELIQRVKVLEEHWLRVGFEEDEDR